VLRNDRIDGCGVDRMSPDSNGEVVKTMMMMMLMMTMMAMMMLTMIKNNSLIHYFEMFDMKAESSKSEVTDAVEGNWG
jgi:hypothetical protein